MKEYTDKELLDFLDKMGGRTGLLWIARNSTTGRGFRVHQDTPGHGADATSARGAIAVALKRSEVSDV